MGLGQLIDAAIEPISPSLAAKRRVARIGLDAIRQYEAAQNGRATKNWRRPSSSADREIGGGLVKLRDGARDLVRNNKFAASAVRQLTAQIVGDGITAQAQHDDPAIQQAAQDEWDTWSASKVFEGRHDFFHVQKLVARGMIEGGEMLQLWRPDGDIPFSVVDVLEGDCLDHTKTQNLADGWIVQGVEFDKNNKRRGYWLFSDHPGAVLWRTNFRSQFTSTDIIDHIFDQHRAPQVRGVSWLAPVMLSLRDAADITNAHRLKEKVAACLALIIETSRENAGSPVLGQREQQGDGKNDVESIEPGMIHRLRPDEKASVLNPSISTDTVNFLRFELGGVAASLVPYYLMTGDVSGANYTSLRALQLGFGALLDDAQQQILIPLGSQPAFDRRMRVKALLTGDLRFRDVKATWAVPKRPLLDPVKDLMGEIMEIRAGLKTMSKALAERGMGTDKVFTEIARLNAIIDKLGLALDTDPRRLTDSGILQAAAGYLAPKGETAANP
jgi:lambda family phage portal protein